MRRFHFIILAVLFTTACGDGGGGGGSADPALAYVLTECTESARGDYTHKQALRLRRGDGTTSTLAELPPVGPLAPLAPLDPCSLWGQYRFGAGSVLSGAFQRLGMRSDGSLIAFEVTDDFSLASRSQVPANQEGIFVVRPDGSGLRRIGNASRNRCFRFDQSTGVGELEPVFFFSPDGSSIAFTDIGPGPGGEETEQIFILDLNTGERRQLTRLPPVLGVEAGRMPVSYPNFLDAETITFNSFANPVIDGVESNPDGRRLIFSVKTYASDTLRAVPVFAEPGSQIIEAFQITGKEPVARGFGVRGEPVNGPGIWGNVIWEIFVFDSESILQLTDFKRSDTAGAHISADRQRIYFYTGADDLGRNPFGNCQLFSIDRLGRDLRQLTEFDEGVQSQVGCTVRPGPGCHINTSGGNLGPDPVSGAFVFMSSCDPFGTNPHGEEVFAIDPDGTNLRQLTDTRGFVQEADGTVLVESPGPAASPVLTR